MIGINKFFQPLYERAGFKATGNNLKRNRYYSHLHELHTVQPCSRDTVCFGRGSGGSAGTGKSTRDPGGSVSEKQGLKQKIKRKKGRGGEEDLSKASKHDEARGEHIEL